MNFNLSYKNNNIEQKLNSKLVVELIISINA